MKIEFEKDYLRELYETGKPADNMLEIDICSLTDITNHYK